MVTFTPPPASASPTQVLVVGSKGMLGQDLLTRLEQSGISVVGMDLPEIDITDSAETLSTVEAVHPNVVINCAAYTAVDRAESEPAVAFAVNRDGSLSLARACRNLDIPLIHISTDYVFDGRMQRPYREDDPGSPVSVYGRSKWEGEEAIRSHQPEHLIVRTAWLYGEHGPNFVKTILRLASERDELRVVADQQGCPTWSRDLADALSIMAGHILRRRATIEWGNYHFCGSGKTTWHEFACAIVEEGRRRVPLNAVRVIPIPASEYPSPAQRPYNSVLDCTKTAAHFQITPPVWTESLKAFMDKLYVECEAK